MAKIKKRGTSGNAKNFITRTQAVRKLQISLPDFRRLCIFKGIYPREPRNKKKANKGNSAPNTFYYTKDIQYLLHEPVLQKFRDHKAFAKKLTKALGRGEYGDAKRLEENHKPVVRLDHIIKERYPSFADALRDLDDALSMLHLFANLPSNEKIQPEIISKCQKVCHEWQHFIIKTHTLRKSFLSIKGIYYQAEIQGQDILWLVPYKFAQNVPGDVDFRIMLTFVEFYTTLLGFVMYRLYTLENWVYPPKFDQKADEAGAGLAAITVEQKETGNAIHAIEAAPAGPTAAEQGAIENLPVVEVTEDMMKTTIEEKKVDEEDAEAEAGINDTKNAIDVFKPIDAANAGDVLAQPILAVREDGTVAEPEDLFKGTVFFLSRETPRDPLEFILRSFGCNSIGWDAVLGEGAFTHDPLDPRITHQVVDRPPMVALPVGPDDDTEMAGQVTARHTAGRVPGRIYVQPQYVWDCINAGKLLKTDVYAPGAMLPPHLSPWVKVDSNGYDPSAPTGLDENGDVVNDMDVDVGSDEESEAEVVKDAAEGSEEEEEEEEESEVEGAPLDAAPSKKDNKRKSELNKKDREEEEQKEMAKMMMPRKKRKLYEKMIYSNSKKDEEAKNLRKKRKELEKARK
ncbi:hypothetical protein BJ508DRAFT_411326 [Ascobolus immersus RN42]|uniref:Pescadillo homolog n=1 Tax=Ascobolus immersus RN42 TaxID=1160509 RepID=A0A3N4IJ17_ASCIM|nr:hypothetical protein BJ508DRAFT_411326 [Ascobolus immersus RN42]